MKINQNEIKRGDIFYFTEKPVTGSEQKGGRPGVIVSNDVNNKFSGVVSVVYITSKNKMDIPEHVPIYSLHRPGIALCEQIHTVSVKRIKGRKGKVTPEEMAQIDKALIESLGLLCPPERMMTL